MVHQDNAGDQRCKVGLGSLSGRAGHLGQCAKSNATEARVERHLGFANHVKAEVETDTGGHTHPSSAFDGNQTRILGLEPLS